jgi:ribosomal protein L11 methyltransferase
MLAFVVSVPVDEVDLASDVLWQLGVRAIEERTPATTAGAAEVVELWTSVGEDRAAVERAGRRVVRWPWRTVEVSEVAADTWRDHAAPMWVDAGMVLVPAWQRHDVGESVLAVRIEPGGAFGLGDHPTTMLSLRALRSMRLTGADVLDVGCGTGVLAVGAALLGAKRVRAVDLSGAAVEATIDNARRNGVTVEVDATPVSRLDGGHDVVVANILAPALCELADDLRRLTRLDGRLVISGVLDRAHDHVVDALAPMVVERRDTLGGWAAVTMRHPAGR